MKIHLYTFAWNEETILPHFLRHYTQFCNRIVIHDNESTDRTVEIAKSFPNTEVRTYKTGEKHAEHDAMVPIRNEVWKESAGFADFVILVDCDEFLHHHDLIGFFRRMKMQGVSLIRAYGWEMVAEETPDPDDGRSLFEVAPMGVQSHIYSKPCILDPNAVEHVEFVHGAHDVTAKGRIVYKGSGSLKLLHYKRLGWDYFWKRTIQLRQRSAMSDVQQGHFAHYRWPYEEHRRLFITMLENAVDVTA